MKNLSQLKTIYLSFAKLGSIGFGGGYALIPLIQIEAVDKRGWIEEEQMIDIFCVAESLPGAIAINSSALVGYHVAGIPGALAAILGNLSPSVIIVLTLSLLFSWFGSHHLVQAAFNGIRPAIIGLIAFAAFKIGKTAIKDFIAACIALLAFTGIMFFHLHPVLLIALGAVAGIVLFPAEKARSIGGLCADFCIKTYQDLMRGRN